MERWECGVLVLPVLLLLAVQRGRRTGLRKGREWGKSKRHVVMRWAVAIAAVAVVVAGCMPRAGTAVADIGLGLRGTLMERREPAQAVELVEVHNGRLRSLAAVSHLHNHAAEVGHSNPAVVADSHTHKPGTVRAVLLAPSSQHRLVVHRGSVHIARSPPTTLPASRTASVPSFPSLLHYVAASLR